MLTHKTLRLMTVISNGDKLRAEQSAAEAVQRLTVLGGQARTLTAYTADLGARLATDGISSGMELKSYGRFIEMGIRARNRNEAAIAAGEAAQEKALNRLAVTTEKHRALSRTTEEARAFAAREEDRTAERRE